MIEIFVEHTTKTANDIAITKWISLDIDKNVGFNTFSLNLKQSDINDPTSIFTNYSKSFTIPGTKHNLNIFNNINRADSIKTDNKTKKCIVNNNGIIVDRGYIRIENVTLNNYKNELSCTFYSELCNLLKNLKYNDNYENYKMHEMFYGLYDSYNGSVFNNNIEETDKYSFNWTAENITNILNDISVININELYSNPKYAVLPVFSHDGYYEDFANNKVLMYMGNSTAYTPDKLCTKLGTTVNEIRTKITNTNNWACFEEARDLSTREAKCYNVKKLKIGVRNSFILDAICNPENNGGYKLKFSDEIKDSTFYKDTFCIFDNITEDEYNTNASYKRYGNKTFSNIVPFSRNIYRSPETYNLSNFNNPKLKIVFPEIDFDLTTSGPKYLFLNRGPKMDSRYNIIAFLINIYVGEDENKKMVKTFLGSTTNNRVSAFKQNVSGRWEQNKMVVNFDYKTIKTVLLEEMNNGRLQKYYSELYELIKNSSEVTGDLLYDQDTARYKFCIQEHNITVDLNSYRSDGSYIYYEFIPLCVNIDNNENNIYINIPALGNESNYIPDNSSARKAGHVFTFTNETGIIQPNLVIPEDSIILYDSTVIGSYDTTYSKELLFTNLTCTPADYLLSFTKLLDLKFYYNVSGEITIMTTSEYYKHYYSNIQNLAAFIDKSKQIDLNVTPYDSKKYVYNYKDNDSYADYLIYKTSKKHPNTVTVVTDAEGNEEKKVIEKLIWTNALDYKMNTPYIGKEAGVESPIADGNYVYLNQWSGQAAEEMETSNNILYRPIDGEVFVEDDIPLLCFFNNKFETLDENITLQFINGLSMNYSFIESGEQLNFEEIIESGEELTDEVLLASINKLYCIVDKMPVMKQMSGEEECYVRVNYKDLKLENGTSGLQNKIYETVPASRKPTTDLRKIYVPRGILMFSNINTKINKTVCLNYDFNNNYLTHNNINPDTIYNFGLADTAKNLYNDEQIEMSCYCVFPCNYNVNDLMRKMFEFNSIVWIINEISNLKIVDNKYIGNCKFIKLTNWSNYIVFDEVNSEDDVL